MRTPGPGDADRKGTAEPDEQGTAQPAAQGADAVTLVDGSTFCVSQASGDMAPDRPEGLFFQDTRIVAKWQLEVAGQIPEVLTVIPEEPYSATFLSRVPPRSAETELLVERRRFVGAGMREDLCLLNVGARAVTTTLSLVLETDFAGVFDVKDARGRPAGEVSTRADANMLEIWLRDGDRSRGVQVSAPAAVADEGGLEFDVTVAAGAAWSTTVLVCPLVDGQPVASAFPADRPLDQSLPALRMRDWRTRTARVATDDADLRRTLRRSSDDIAGLRIVDADHPDEVAVAAGAPWFMALFGRDSLLASYMALALDPTLALGTLRALARVQGERVDRATEEQPGRIVHETRLGLEFPLAGAGAGAGAYYGTADATPLFVVLLGELARWGAERSDIDALLPHADRALDWVERDGDSDGDGFVEYQRLGARGLVSQGWKDSPDGITFADGSLPEPPIALCEVQGYVYAAFVARAELARTTGDQAAARRWADRAARLKREFNERFWLADKGWFAVGLDRDKRPIDALASNMGHCLWSGVVDEDKAPRVAERLMAPEMFTGWGVRTLASSMGAYNPMSYHNGSVWPHDSALVATGLMRYGFVEAAQRIACGLLDAAAALGGRLPELICGFDRTRYRVPVVYPTSCSPQAWASATPVQLLRILLRLDPAMPRRQVWLAPVWPRRHGRLRIDGLPIAGRRTALRVDEDGWQLSGLPDDVEIRDQPRPTTPAG